MRILVTGGAGFIGSAVVRHIINTTPHTVLVYDKLTYAGTLTSLASIAQNPRFSFVRGDVADRSAVETVLRTFRPHKILNLAAETHVDRSIDAPADFIHTNIVGTEVLLEAALAYWQKGEPGDAFRFHHISTDEVFGSLGREGLFREDSPYSPRSPYAASKAASDHLVCAFFHTYQLPTLITNCSNNYGPYHFPEKLIPLTILNALEGQALPVYGRGENVRDWLHVEDHAEALLLVLERGQVGESYNIGGRAERRNIEVVEAICDVLDELRPTEHPYRTRIHFVTDRPGHDLRYAIDPSKIERELGWKPRRSFSTGLRETVKWYLDNEAWWAPLRRETYAGERLGIGVRA